MAFILFTAFNSKQDEEPVLIKATLKTHTNDDDKDHDTGIYVEVKSGDGQSLIAVANDRDESASDGTQYKDDSDHQFDLELGDAVGMTKSSCKGFKVKLWQQTHNGRGHDTWKFNGKLILIFSDKSNLIASVENVTLESRGTNEQPAVEFSNPQ